MKKVFKFLIKYWWVVGFAFVVLFICGLFAMCTGGGGGDNKQPIPVSFLKVENQILKGLSDSGKSANYENYDTLEIPLNVTAIDPNAFVNTSVPDSFVNNIEYINFTEGCQLTSIGDWCFGGLTKLTMAELPDTLSLFGTSAFENDVNFCMLIIHSNNFVPYSSSLLTNTLFKTNVDTNQGLVVLNSQALVNTYSTSSGWNQFPLDAFQANE